ncbi:hypothetical protein J1614_008724, partial [Plenodomus biglobosus]
HQPKAYLASYIPIYLPTYLLKDGFEQTVQVGRVDKWYCDPRTEGDMKAWCTHAPVAMLDWAQWLSVLHCDPSIPFLNLVAVLLEVQLMNLCRSSPSILNRNWATDLVLAYVQLVAYDCLISKRALLAGLFSQRLFTVTSWRDLLVVVDRGSSHNVGAPHMEYFYLENEHFDGYEEPNGSFFQTVEAATQRLENVGTFYCN